MNHIVTVVRSDRVSGPCLSETRHLNLPTATTKAVSLPIPNRERHLQGALGRELPRRLECVGRAERRRRFRRAGRLLQFGRLTAASAPTAVSRYACHRAPKRRRDAQFRDPVECGGKRSATPLLEGRGQVAGRLLDDLRPSLFWFAFCCLQRDGVWLNPSACGVDSAKACWWRCWSV